jgi:hypothetical protein
MTLPGFYAEESLRPLRTVYAGKVTVSRERNPSVVPAMSCAGVDCEAAQFFCYLSLDLDPVSCGIFYGCCNAAGRTGAGTYPDAGADIPPSMNLPITSAETDALTAQLDRIERRLKRIERCACPPPTIAGVTTLRDYLSDIPRKLPPFVR